MLHFAIHLEPTFLISDIRTLLFYSCTEATFTQFWEFTYVTLLIWAVVNSLHGTGVSIAIQV